MDNENLDAQSTPPEINQVAQESTSFVAEEPQQDTPKKISKIPKTAIYILVSIVLLALGAFGFWFYQEKITKRPGDTAPSTLPTTTPSAETESTALIPENWKIYSSKTLSLEFALPPEFHSQSNFSEKTIPGESGSILCITYPPKTSGLIKPVMAGAIGCQITSFGLSTSSVDFEQGRMAGFSDLQGYAVENGRYYAVLSAVKKFEIPNELVQAIDNPNGLKILKITGKNSTSEDWQGPIAGTPGEGWIGALINIPNNQTYRGVAISMELSQKLTDEIFTQILSTVRLLNESEQLINQITVVEKEMGYIKNVYQKDGENFLDIDYIQWLMGQTGSRACVDDGNCEEPCLVNNACLPNGYYIRNQNSQIRTFKVKAETLVTMVYLTPEKQSEKVTFERFMEIFNSSDEQLSHFKNAPYNIEIEGEAVILISQQYVP